MLPWRITPVPPSDECVERGGRFISVVEWEGARNGKLIDGFSNTVSWNLETDPGRSPYSPFNLVRKPDFVALDTNGVRVFRIRRVSRLPATFEMIENGIRIGQIRLRSVFRNKYTIHLQNGTVWTFRMPLFTIGFWGVSNQGTRVWAWIGSGKRQWNILTEQGVSVQPLLFALAFIHREWFVYS